MCVTKESAHLMRAEKQKRETGRGHDPSICFKGMPPVTEVHSKGLTS
jgi:hypothetical protein